MEGRRCGRTLLKGLVMSSEPKHQDGVVLPLQGMGKCSSECDSVCVCVLGHVFVRVCACTKGKQSLNKETMPFKVFPEDEGGREGKRKECGKDGKGK